MPRMVARDQFGDMVDLYDFGGALTTQRGVIVVACAEWTGPCHDFAEWLSGQHNDYYDPWTGTRDQIDAGELGVCC